MIVVVAIIIGYAVIIVYRLCYYCIISITVIVVRVLLFETAKLINF